MKRQSDSEAVAALMGSLACALVDRPELVRVEVVHGTNVTILEVEVGAADVGKLIGRGGRTGAAIRTVLKAMGGRDRIRYELEILEPNQAGGRTDGFPREGGEPDHWTPYPAFEQDPVQATTELLRRLTQSLVDDEQAVEVRTLVGSQAAVFEVRTDQRDVPRVLGRGGRTVSALRELLRNLGVKAGRRFLLELVEPVDKVA